MKLDQIWGGFFLPGFLGGFTQKNPPGFLYLPRFLNPALQTQVVYQI